MTPKNATDAVDGRPRDGLGPLLFWSTLTADVVAHVSPEDRPHTRRGWFAVGLAVVFRSSGFHAVFLYRLAHWLRQVRPGLCGRMASGFLFWLGRHFYGCSIAPTARLYGGLVLPHPQGIVIGPGVVVGPRAWIFQNVTLGGAPGKEGMPRIGEDSRIFTGAVITGPVTLGDHVIVGAGAVVYKDVPSRSLVRCPEMQVAPLPLQLRGETSGE